MTRFVARNQMKFLRLLTVVSGLLITSSLLAMTPLPLTVTKILPSAGTIFPCPAPTQPTITCGSTFTYQINVRNDNLFFGATNITITDMIAPPLTFVSVCDDTLGSITYTKPTVGCPGQLIATTPQLISSGGLLNIYVTVQIPSPFCCSFSNFATSVATIDGLQFSSSSNTVSTILPTFTASLSASSLTVCEGQTVTLNATPTGGSNYTFNQTPGGFVDNGNNPTLVVTPTAPSTTYTVTVTGSDCNGNSNTCTNTSEPLTVNVIPCENTTLVVVGCCKPEISSCDRVSYTIYIKNTGQVAAQNLKVVDLLPSCLTFCSGKGDGWTFTADGQEVTATLSQPLQPGATTSLTIKAKAKCASGQNITNTVTVSADNVVGPQVFSCTTKVN